MKTLAKKDLHLIGSAATLEALRQLIVSKLYWSRCDIFASGVFSSRLGKCYDVGNAKGIIEGFVIIEGKRCGFYSINL